MTKLKHDFLIFHFKNPQLWYWIDHFALQRARSGWAHYGIKSVIERARWETAIQTVDGGTNTHDGEERDYKICNNHTAHYSRMWMLLHPEYDGFFRTRHIPDDDLPDAKDYGFPEELFKV